MKTRFLSRFYEDDTEVTIDKLLSTVQKKGESVRDYIERFRNVSLICPAGMSMPMYGIRISHHAVQINDDDPWFSRLKMTVNQRPFQSFFK